MKRLADYVRCVVERGHASPDHRDGGSGRNAERKYPNGLMLIGLALLVLTAFDVRAHTVAPENHVDSCNSAVTPNNTGAFGAEPGGSITCFQPGIDLWNATPCPGRSQTLSLGTTTTATNTQQIVRTHCTTGVVTFINGTYTTAGPATVCPAGHHLDGGMCVDDVVCTGGDVVSSGIYAAPSNGTDPVRTACTGGCETGFNGGMKGRQVVGGKYVYYFEGEYRKTGGTCTEAPENAQPSAGTIPTNITCGVGQTVGTINGVQQCFDTGTGAPANPHTGTTTTPTTTTRESTPGGGIKETTTHPDGSKTVTEFDSDGKQISTHQEDVDPMKPFCELNPDAPICAPSSFGGACSVFVCDGDAVQCAIALEQHKRNCTLFETATAFSTLGNSAAAGTDAGTANNPAAVANRETRSVGSLNQSAFISAAPLADVTYSIGEYAGQSYSVTVPYSMLVSILTWAGVAAVALTLLWAARFVLGA